MVDSTANQAIQDSVLRRQVYLEKYTAQMQNSIQTMLDSTEGTVRAEIERRLSSLLGTSGYAPFNADTNSKLAALAQSIYDTRSEALNKGFDKLGSDLTDLGPMEAQHLDDALNAHSPVRLDTTLPDQTLLAAIATSVPMQGRILSDWASSIAVADQQQIMDAINVGMATGATTDSIVRDVLGTGIMNGADGVTEITRRNAASVTQTAIATTANEARAAYSQANSDILGDEVWVATLDPATCPECSALDGQHFKVGEGIQPPAHFNCRCVRVATLDGQLIGDRPATTATEENLAGLSDDERAKAVAEMTGQVPASQTYQEWLTNQSPDFQDEVLGPARGEMFRSGNLPLSRFVNRDGDYLTLDELAQRGAASMFISPNVEVGLNFDDAVKGMDTIRQQAVLDANQQINDLLGLDGDQRNVVGAWATGAENSVAMDIPAGTDYDTLRAAAAMKGEIANQQAVLVFQSGNGEAQALSKFELPGTLADVHKALLADGIENHTLEQLADGKVGVTVLSMDQKALEAVNAVGERYGIEIDTSLGKGEFIGSQLSQDAATDAAIRADAVNQYEGVIRSYLAQQSADTGLGWDRVLANWNSTAITLPGVQATGSLEADAVVKQWIARSPISSVEQLFEGSKENDVLLKQVGKEIEGSIPNIQFRAPGIKKMARTLEKIAGSSGSPAGVTDVVRATFAVNSPEDVEKVVAALGKHFPIANEDWRTTPFGYFDNPTKILFKNGQIGEVLIAPPELIEAKSDTGGGGHLLYVKARSLLDGDPLKAELALKQQAVYSAARAALPPEWASVVNKLKKFEQPVKSAVVSVADALKEAERESLLKEAAAHVALDKIVEGG